MNVSITRDGLTLRGELQKPDRDKCPMVIIFHGFMGSRQSPLLCRIGDECVKRGMAALRFDFDGHGESDGSFSDMTVYSELLDASKIMDYVRSLDFVTDIYIVGHSQGGVVAGMTAGYFRDRVTKLVMLAPAASLKEDAQNNYYMGTHYDLRILPDFFPVVNNKNERLNLGHMYIRTAKTLPIYETTSMFGGQTLIIHGTKDDVVTVAGSKGYKEHMPEAHLVLIEGEGHSLCEFSGDDVVKMTADFLSR